MSELLLCAYAFPQKAIQLTIPEKNFNARYRSEHISLKKLLIQIIKNNMEVFTMDKFTFSYPTRVYFGEGSAEQAFLAVLGKVGKTVMLAYGGGSVK